MLPHRVQPRDEDVRPLSAGELEVRHRDVGAPLLQVRRTHGEDLGRRRLEQIEHHGEVVRRERPEDALALAHAPGVEAVRVEVLGSSQVAAPKQVLQLQDRRMVERDVADHEDAAERSETRPAPRPRQDPGSAASRRTRPCRRSAPRAPARSEWPEASRSRRPPSPGRRASRRTTAHAARAGPRRARGNGVMDRAQLPKSARTRSRFFPTLLRR